jgi:putative tricarboxylic transport membrane protein
MTVTPDEAPARLRILARHRCGPLVLLVLGIGALVASVDMSLGELTNPGPGLWPFVVSVLLTGVALVLLAVDDPDDYEGWSRRSVRIAVGLVSLGVFIVLFQAAGFLLAALLMLVFWLRFYGEEGWRWTIPLAIGGAVGLYLLFDRALGVPFPPDALLVLAGA